MFVSHPLANDHISFALTVTPLKQDILEGMRTVALKLEFGVHHNQIFERYFFLVVANLDYRFSTSIRGLT